LPGRHQSFPGDQLAPEAFHSRETTEIVAAYYGITDPKLRRAIARLILVMSKVQPRS
jgi:hypothetical protein